MSASFAAAVVGPSASGKTALSMALARRDADVELCSVDALACYRRLDLGTAKPTAAEQAEVPWHLIDLVDPANEFSLAEFARCAESVAKDLSARAKQGVLVGGSSLYLRALLDGLTPPPRFEEIAARLEARADAEGVPALHEELARLDPLGATRMEPTNRRRVLRALEVTIGSGQPFSSFGPGLDVYPPITTRLVGLTFGREELDRRVEARLDTQMADGFLEEVEGLMRDEVVLSRTAAQAIGYRELAEVVRKELSMADARTEILRRTRSLVRRQMAWLRRDPRIVWLDAAQPNLVERAAELLFADANRPSAPTSAGPV